MKLVSFLIWSITIFYGENQGVAMEERGQDGTQEKDIDDYDLICADHMVMVFHAYDQSLKNDPIDFRQPVLQSSKFAYVIPYEITRDSIHKDLYQGWIFKPFYGLTGLKVYPIDWRVKSMVGMIGYHREQNILTITYRGTQQMSDMWNNLNFYRRKCPYVQENLSFHSGYLDIFESSWPSLKEALDDLTQPMAKETLTDLKVLITGYSLGGATAAIAVVSLKEYFPASHLRLSIFGAPRVGEAKFNNWLKDNNITAKSFVRKTDYTPYNPSCYGLSDVGNYIELPDYGDAAYAWPMAHDCRKYQQAIYEYLNRSDQYKGLFKVFIPWLGKSEY